MSEWSTAAGCVLLAAGVFIIASAVVGLFRLPGILARLHAAAAAAGTGMLLTLGGVGLLHGWSGAAAKILLLAAFFLLTAPTAIHILCAAAIEETEEEKR